LGGIMATAYAPIIAAEEVTQWETYSQENQGWIGDSTVLRQVHPGHRQPMEGTIQDHEFDRRLDSGSIKPYIWRWEDGEQVQETTFSGNVLAPFWQSSPADAASVNQNLLANKDIAHLFSLVVEMNHTVISHAVQIDRLFDFVFDLHEKERKKNPHSFIMEPVYAEFYENPVLVGILIAISAWENLFDRVLPEGTNGLVCVVKDTCGNVFTYEINGEIATHLGYLDLHDERFDQYQRTTPIELYESEAASLCKHDLYIYPSSTFRSAYNTNRPAIYTSVVALAFAFTALLLLMYDKLVSRRQEKTMTSAIRTNALVSSLFPENIRDRLIGYNGLDHGSKMISGNEKTMENYGNKALVNAPFHSRPIADFFPQTTVRILKDKERHLASSF
jgi:hypothetical protein